MEPETLEAKLRNQLTPIYGLADMVLAMEKHEFKNTELNKLVVETAKQVKKNQLQIINLLQQIESRPNEVYGNATISGVPFVPYVEPKTCDCKRQFDYTSKFICDGNCR